MTTERKHTENQTQDHIVAPVMKASNVTGRHRGPKQKLQAGYRAPSLQRTSHFSSLSVLSRIFSPVCMHSKLGHHPHPLEYLCAKFRFCGNLRYWASPWRKMAYSINQ